MEAVAELINLPTFLASLVGFILLLVILRPVLWGAVPRVIDERRDSIEKAFGEVEDARSAADRLKVDYEQRIQQITSEAQQKMQEAIDKGQQVAAEIRAAAEDSREKLLARTQEDIAREKAKAIAEIRDSAVELSFAISQKVMKEGLDKQQHDRLVSSFIGELRELK